MPDIPQEAGQWHIDSMDGFDMDAYPYRLSGPYGTEDEALRAADGHFADLEASQPSASSGGLWGIQDRLYLVRPDGTSMRLHNRSPASSDPGKMTA